MMEPKSRDAVTGLEDMPYSHHSVSVLRVLAMGNPRPVETQPEHYDYDFRKRYAAILLRERGL